jgi:predicted glycogen debranching enzyme
VKQLVLAADQFIVNRPLRDNREARSVIAGYHWFGDWGRDTMVALPGLTLSTGRPEVARSLLRTFAKFVDQGMLPNRFPEAGEAPEYNTVDATLWYFEAVRQYHAATHDESLLRELFPVLTGILDWHIRGTRHGIQVDEKDGLLFGGEPGVQLTWMDAKVDDWVATPRIGKPVEVNALWYNALLTTADFAVFLKKTPGEYRARAERVRKSFECFWNAAAGYCFDVIDGPEGNDASLRPNQLFAVSLPQSPLNEEQQRAVVDVCARHLLTSYGLRSLAPDDAHYKARYGGSRYDRDAAYHQGTVWGWLVGPFILAHLRVYRDPELARLFLEPFTHHLRQHGLGTASEIFDGDPPFTPRGCIAQAWTVGEVLRAWTAIMDAQLERTRK